MLAIWSLVPVSKSVKSLSCVRLFVTPWTAANQDPQSMGFSRQEYWSGLPFPSPGDLPDPGIEPRSPALEADALTCFSKSSLNIWKFTVHVLLKPGLENFEHYFASVWDECHCVVFQHILAWPFFGIGVKTDLFPVLWPLLTFPNSLAYWVQCINSIIF